MGKEEILGDDKAISVGTLNKDGSIGYVTYKDKDIGVCMQKTEEPFDYGKVVAIIIVVFALTLITIATYCIYTQATSNRRHDHRR